MLTSAPTLTSCFLGTFSCMNSMLEWNENISDNRYIAALVSIVLGPVELSIGSLLDIVIFNSMEFWTGSNPMAATEVVGGQDGNTYAIAPNGKGGYLVTCQQTGQQMEYLFDAYTRTWSASMEGQTVKLFTLTTPHTAQVYGQHGDILTVSLSREGLYACQQAFTDHADLALN